MTEDKDKARDKRYYDKSSYIPAQRQDKNCKEKAGGVEVIK
jgi:hypothetical protein